MITILNKIVWYIVIVMIIYVGFNLTFKLKFVQFKFIRMFNSILTKESRNKLSALFLTLAGKIGVGSIAGVALAIYIGGIGTIFWLVIFTFLMAVITYAETYLGLKYQIKNYDQYEGGPSYYIEQGLKNKWLANIYSILIIIAYTFGFISIQSNTIGKMFLITSNINLIILGLIISLLVFLIIIKGIEQIIRITNLLVPIMLILYIAIALYLVIININEIPYLVKQIIVSGLKLKPFISGFIYQMIIGIQRSEFASEAGLGTAAIGASISNTIPTFQAYIQMFGVYITNILVCLSSAFIILLSPYQNIKLNNINGIEFSLYAFNYHFGSKGVILLLIFVFLFSFSTILTCYYYSLVSLKFLFNKKFRYLILLLKILVPIICYIGMFLNSARLWIIIDILVGICTLINMYSIYKLKNKLNG